MIGILGKKLGMTQIFTEKAERISVTAIEAGPCPVLALKEKNIQLGFDLAGENSLKKPLLGYFKKLNIAPRKVIKEFLKEPDKEFKVGEEIKVDIFKTGDFVDITGTSLGKGFQGGVKRWHWRGGYGSRGSTSHRRVGSMGSTTTPGRVFKGHHEAGHMGHLNVTLQNLKVVKVDTQNNLLFVEGNVPGHKNGYLIIRKAVKKRLLKATKEK